MRKQRGSGKDGCNTTICMPMKNGVVDYTELRRLITQEKDKHLRGFGATLSAKIKVEKSDMPDHEKVKELERLKLDFIRFVRGSLCLEFDLMASRSYTPPWSVTCKNRTHTPKKLEVIADGLWDNLELITDPEIEPPQRTEQRRPTSREQVPAHVAQPQVGKNLTVGELRNLYNKPLGWHGAPGEDSKIGKLTTVAVREGGKAYSRRLFSKPPSTCMRGRKKSTERNKRTRRRR